MKPTIPSIFSTLILNLIHIWQKHHYIQCKIKTNTTVTIFEFLISNIYSKYKWKHLSVSIRLLGRYSRFLVPAEVGAVRFRFKFWLFFLLQEILPAVLFTEVHGIFWGFKLHHHIWQWVTAWGPSHQGIFPSLPSIKINLPPSCSEYSWLHRILSGHVDLDSTCLDVFLRYPSQAGDISLFGHHDLSFCISGFRFYVGSYNRPELIFGGIAPWFNLWNQSCKTSKASFGDQRHCWWLNKSP